MSLGKIHTIPGNKLHMGRLRHACTTVVTANIYHSVHTCIHLGYTTFSIVLFKLDLGRMYIHNGSACKTIHKENVTHWIVQISRFSLLKLYSIFIGFQSRISTRSTCMKQIDEHSLFVILESRQV